MKKAYMLIALLFILMPHMTVYAIAPPYGYVTDDESDLMASFKEYVDYYPTGVEKGELGYGQSRQGYRLEQRRVIWPKVADPNFTVQSCGYGESRWGDGVNYTYTSFTETSNISETPNIRVILYYDYSDPVEVYKTYFFNVDEEADMVAEEGFYNGMPYYAYTYINKLDGSHYCVYNLVMGDILINVHDAEPFSENRVGLIQYEETEILLPVYVNEQDYISNQIETPIETLDQNGLFIKQIDLCVWMYCGIAVTLIGLVGYVVWIKVHKR